MIFPGPERPPKARTGAGPPEPGEEHLTVYQGGGGRGKPREGSVRNRQQQGCPSRVGPRPLRWGWVGWWAFSGVEGRTTTLVLQPGLAAAEGRSPASAAWTGSQASRAPSRAPGRFRRLLPAERRIASRRQSQKLRASPSPRASERGQRENQRAKRGNLFSCTCVCAHIDIHA